MSPVPEMMSETTLAFGMPGGPEWIVLLVLGLLIFGRRLPEVGRSLGRGIVEFKKGIKGIEDEIEDSSAQPLPKSTPSDQLPPNPAASPAAGSDPNEVRVGNEASNPYRPANGANES